MPLNIPEIFEAEESVVLSSAEAFISLQDEALAILEEEFLSIGYSVQAFDDGIIVEGEGQSSGTVGDIRSVVGAAKIAAREVLTSATMRQQTLDEIIVEIPQVSIEEVFVSAAANVSEYEASVMRQVRRTGLSQIEEYDPSVSQIVIRREEEVIVFEDRNKTRQKQEEEMLLLGMF